MRGTAKPYSDLDIALQADGPIALTILSALEEAYADSDLPFKVDLIDWARVSEEFRQVILRDYEVL